jgi:hypothetical protein
VDSTGKRGKIVRKDKLTEPNSQETKHYFMGEGGGRFKRWFPHQNVNNGTVRKEAI